MLPAVAFAVLTVFLIFQLGKDLGSGTFMASSISPRGDTHVDQKGASDTHKEGTEPQRSLEELEPSQPFSIDKVEFKDPFKRPAQVLVESPREINPDLVSADRSPDGYPTLIRRSRIALAVENREPIGVRDRVSVREGRVYCWMHVINGKGRRLTVRWIAKGREFWETRLAVGSDNWRTWAYVTLRPSLVGPARVDIVNDDGELLYTESFEITG
jgi:hypothetical protein